MSIISFLAVYSATSLVSLTHPLLFPLPHSILGRITRGTQVARRAELEIHLSLLLVSTLPVPPSRPFFPTSHLLLVLAEKGRSALDDPRIFLIVVQLGPTAFRCDDSWRDGSGSGGRLRLGRLMPDGSLGFSSRTRRDLSGIFAAEYHPVEITIFPTRPDTCFRGRVVSLLTRIEQCRKSAFLLRVGNGDLIILRSASIPGSPHQWDSFFE